MNRPYVIASCAMTIDGYIDDATAERLLLSNDADFDRVDDVRASVDAILVGAETVRRDNPRLLVRSSQRQADRTARGLPVSPVKVTVTNRGDLDPQASFFTTGDTAKIVYCADDAAEKLRERIAADIDVVSVGQPVDLTAVLADLASRGLRRLMVEGGTSMHTQFLAGDLVDELHLVVAPFFVGDSRAARFVGNATFPYTSTRRLHLADVSSIGDCALLRYQRPVGSGGPTTVNG